MSSKGITPVVATVLLIMIGVGATGVVATIVFDTQERAKENWEDEFSNQELQSKSDISVDFMYNKSKFLFISVRNSGSITMPIKQEGEKNWNIFIEGRPIDKGDWEVDGKESEPEVLLDPQQTMPLNTSIRYPSEGEDKSIKIAAQYETSASVVCYNSGAGSC